MELKHILLAFTLGFASFCPTSAVSCGDPLFLTPLLQAGKIAEARSASLVKYSPFDPIVSYTGFFTVNETFDSNLFFWFIVSENDFQNDPILLWLQGGPGSSSLLALFTENGPFIVDENLNVSFREFSWSKSHSLLYIDNPVGTGFSFTDGGYAQNETKVAEDLYNALLQFFTLFPELRQNDFYVTGESYAGKYVPAISYWIHKENPSADFQINLKGLTIGDGLTDPENMMVYSDYLYQIGLIDKNTKHTMKEAEDRTRKAIQEKQFMKAFEEFDTIINGDFVNTTIYRNASGLSNYYNYVTLQNIGGYYPDLLNTTEVRQAIHVGNLPYGQNGEVETNLKEDIVKSVAPWVSELLSHYRVMTYNGQLDVIVAYPLTINWLSKLNFSGAEEYKTADRQIWMVDNEVAGYIKQAANLTEVMVRNAGHLVPSDQPKWAYDLIYNFVRNTL